MRRALCVGALFLLAGCAGAKPYLEVGLSYSFPFSTDHWVHPDRSWQCEPPRVDAEVGLEWHSGISAGLYHESMLLCGSFNDKPEIFQNGARLSGRWGGW